jgi:hypothetical protein
MKVDSSFLSREQNLICGIEGGFTDKKGRFSSKREICHLIYLFMFYLTMLSVAQIIQSPVVGRLMNG